MSQANTVISVVDDDRSMARMLCRVINAEGFDVRWFGSAEEFLDSGRFEDNGCLILDVNLPGISGIDLQQHLNDSGLEIPILFVSAQGDDALRQRALNAGAAGFFNKPLSIEALLASIRSVVALSVS
ncbi:MAG TPA: response regulator [Pyrinomonadaceae bacterium]|nr:response regulator [Pyrinomonadaceae bacterium]